MVAPKLPDEPVRSGRLPALFGRSEEKANADRYRVERVLGLAIAAITRRRALKAN
jgi:hypothetical protein